MWFMKQITEHSLEELLELKCNQMVYGIIGLNVMLVAGKHWSKRTNMSKSQTLPLKHLLYLWIKTHD